MAVKDHDIQEDYTINVSGSVVDDANGTLPDNQKFVPFRFYAFGPFNIRKQTPVAPYRTFIGEQKT
tara:strand:- start:495 stop:692 length:198 start_codon:yes stop_codon:yes gene_type:complete